MKPFIYFLSLIILSACFYPQPLSMAPEGENPCTDEVNEGELEKVEPVAFDENVSTYEFPELGLRFDLDARYNTFIFDDETSYERITFELKDKGACVAVYGDSFSPGILVYSDMNLEEVMAGNLAEAEYSGGTVETVSIGEESYKHISFDWFGSSIIHSYFIERNDKIYEIVALEDTATPQLSSTELVENMLKTIEFF